MEARSDAIRDWPGLLFKIENNLEWFQERLDEVQMEGGDSPWEPKLKACIGSGDIRGILPGVMIV